MPVEDHPVHPSTSIGTDVKYGCHSSRRPPLTPGGYFAPDGVRMAGEQSDGRQVALVKLRFIPHRMSNKCRSFELWDTDPRCAGCECPRDLEYVKK